MTNLQEKATEAQIQRGILDYLGYRNIFHWRNNTGSFVAEYKGKTRYVNFGAKGSPDIFALVDGELFGIEVKRDKGIQNINQKEYEVEFVRNGGFYILARSIDDVSKVI